MRIIGFGAGDPPPLPGDEECEVYMATRGWEYCADWREPWEDPETGESYPGRWTRIIMKEVRDEPNDRFIHQMLEVSQVGTNPETWSRLADLAEHGLARICEENGVAYEPVLEHSA